MNRVQTWAIAAVAGCLLAVSSASAQVRPYVGFVYPAGGQQGTTFQVKLGGQGLDDLNEAIVSGKGVKAKVVEYHRKLGPQEMQLLREQANILRRGKRGLIASLAGQNTSSGGEMMMDAGGQRRSRPTGVSDDATLKLIDKIEQRMAAYVQRPACASIASLAVVEVTIAPDAEPGEREFRLATPRGVSNPLVFHVGQVPETTRKPMRTAEFQVLGKEELALRKRPDDEVEKRITVPCTVNGQIASGEVNYYRFDARKGQRLMVSAKARQLVPYIADAVPGWFQPVLALYDAKGKEVAYDDDYRFKPDPVILYNVPKDGEYVFTITDAIYRGREDFVYRVTIGELPFITSIFPLGGRAGALPEIEMKGWNLDGARLQRPAAGSLPGIQSLVAVKEKHISNPVPFEISQLPECLEKEPNQSIAQAQKVKLPVIINGRINRRDDWDVFQVAAKAGDILVAEVTARRLESPLDSVLKITDAKGKLLALNDDCEDPGAGPNTHHADSYLMVKIPADGDYFVHLGDASRNGGEEYAYRLRISAPRPDFSLEIVPSSIAMRSRGSNNVNVYAIRKDGFAGQIKLRLKGAPEGFTLWPDKISAGQLISRLMIKTNLVETKEPVNLFIEGTAKVGNRDIVREAIPAEDRMQAFLWRHLVPAEEMAVLVSDPSYQPVQKRVHKVTPPSAIKPVATKTDSSKPAPKFTKQQVAGRLRQLLLLFEEGLLTDEFYDAKVAECETVAQ